MTDFRLNNKHRKELRAFAARTLVCTEEQQAEDAAHTALIEATTAAVNEAIPPADLEVLKRYDCVTRTSTVRLRSVSDVRVAQRTGMWDLPFAWHMQLTDRIPMDTEARLIALYRAHNAARIHNKTARERVLEAVNAAITQARTYSELVAVWPDAAHAGITPIIAKELPALVDATTWAERLRGATFVVKAEPVGAEATEVQPVEPTEEGRHD